MSNTMTAAHEPINYLDSILNEEEKRCEYGHQWRNFTISRSGRFRSKNKKRDVVDGQLFDGAANAANAAGSKEGEKISVRSSNSSMSKPYQSAATNSTTTNSTVAATGAGAGGARSQRDKMESYKSFYETNL